MKLYELTKAYSELENLLEDTDDVKIVSYLEECEGALQEKATNIAMVIQNLEATANAISEAEKNMANRRKFIENRIQSIKDYVLSNMQAAEIQKIECAYFKISRKKNPPKVVIDDESLIPIAYLRQPEPPPPSPDKKAILADIKEGVIVEGAHIEQTEWLEIR